ncbi:MAG: hypothetical protein MJE77_17600 [Proteobacteria bacterium]|nr:hypothetical protein [Pseudomonadota bacterium]
MTKRPQSNLELIKRVLGDEYLELELTHLHADEEAENGSDEAVAQCSVSVETIDNNGSQQKVEGKGIGLVDAVFNGLLGRYALEYQSLKSVELVDFRVEGHMGTKKAKTGGDAMATVTVDVRNSRGILFSFSDESRSITTSSARAVLAIAEYFINAERAFITLYKSRKDAQERNRPDLVGRYTREMAEVVKSTSYAEVIENITNELG